MTNSEIFARCVRELRNSKNLAMLTIAKRYSDLFINQTTACTDLYRSLIDSIYKATKKRLE